MLNTKLIFVDGITGSGKSTTAHFIARQLEKNGIKAKWFHEGETGNPLDQLSQNKDENDNDFAIRFMKEYPEERYEKFVSSVKDDDCIYIVDSFLFQDIIWIPLFYDISKEDIKKFVHKLCSIVDCLNPVVIHYYQSDIEKAMRENWLRRGDQWKDWLVGREELSPYCKNRNISGESGTIEFWKGISDLSREMDLQQKSVQFLSG